jgi:hypothetical protein
VVVFEPHRSKVAAAKLHAKGGDGARRGVHLLALLPRARLVSVVSRVSSVSIGNRVYSERYIVYDLLTYLRTSPSARLGWGEPDAPPPKLALLLRARASSALLRSLRRSATW